MPLALALPPGRDDGVVRDADARAVPPARPRAAAPDGRRPAAGGAVRGAVRRPGRPHPALHLPRAVGAVPDRRPVERARPLRPDHARREPARLAPGLRRRLPTAVPLGRFPPRWPRWWAYPTSYHDTSNHGTYDPGRTTRISGGLMRIHLHTAGGRARVSAPVPRIPGTTSRRNGSPGGLRYGRYSVRFRADPRARVQDRLAALARLGPLARRRRDRLPRGQPQRHDRGLRPPRGRVARAATRPPSAPGGPTPGGTPPPPSGPRASCGSSSTTASSAPRRRACPARPCTGCSRRRRG